MYIFTTLKKKIENLNIKVAIVPLPLYNGMYMLDYIYDFVAAAKFVIYLDENKHIKYLKLMDWKIKRNKKKEII